MAKNVEQIDFVSFVGDNENDDGETLSEVDSEVARRRLGREGSR